MNGLTIEQARSILGVSYPTMFKIAQEHGEQVGGRNTWYIPADVVLKRIEQEQARVDKMKEELGRLGLLVAQ